MKELADYIQRRLPREHWKLLQPVPTWEGVLYYDPLDFKIDRPLTFFRRLYCRELKMDIIYPLRVYEKDAKKSSRKRGSKCKPMFRREIKFKFKEKIIHIKCSTLTMLCYMGFTIADPRHNVVMHMDEDCLNDRPSNLKVGTQRENMRMSTASFRHNHSKENLMVLKRARQKAAEARKKRVKKLMTKPPLTPPQGEENGPGGQSPVDEMSLKAKLIASIHKDIERTVDLEIEMAIDEMDRAPEHRK